MMQIGFNGSRYCNEISFPLLTFLHACHNTAPQKTYFRTKCLLCLEVSELGYFQFSSEGCFRFSDRCNSTSISPAKCMYVKDG